MSIPLTVIIPNRDRMCATSNGTKLFLESIRRQTAHNFKVIIIDGGSENYSEIKEYIDSFNIENISVIQRVIIGKFHKTLLNNIAIRKAETPFIMTTDADIFFAKEFFETLIDGLTPEVFVESRTMYWKNGIANSIYEGRLNPFDDLDSCKIGRIKKRTTPGGCQCGHVDIWNKVRGYDERYLGWGSEDVDLLDRVIKAGYRVKWLGESRDSIMVFHQPHGKIDHEEDLRDQDRNLKFYRNIRTCAANPNSWGDVTDGVKQ